MIGLANKYKIQKIVFGPNTSTSDLLFLLKKLEYSPEIVVDSLDIDLLNAKKLAYLLWELGPKSISFCSTNFNHGAIRSIVSQFPPQTEELKLSRVSLSPDQISELESLSKLASLKRVILSSCNLQDNNFWDLFSSLPLTITSLNLSYNLGLRNCGESLKHLANKYENLYLEELLLDGCYIGNEGLLNLEPILNNEHLQSVSLRCNNLTDESIDFILSKLLNGSIRTVDLRANLFSPAGLAKLKENASPKIEQLLLTFDEK